MAVALVATRKFSVLQRTAPRRSFGGSTLPRVRAADVASPATLAALRARGYAIVTDLGVEMEAAIAAHEAALSSFFASPEAVRAACVGHVYANERGLPMFHRGYERQAGVRECFRSCDPSLQPWPSKAAERATAALVAGLKALADAVLAAALAGRGAECEGRAPAAIDPDDDDFSLTYAFAYGVADGGANGGDGATLVGEHVDVSLVVLEPVARVPGLEVYDAGLRAWLPVEANCDPGRELVLLGGAAFENATGIPACRHRVVKATPPRPRFVCLYEQKYAAFFRHLRHFGD